MRVPLSWLREFVDIDLDVDALAARLTQLGMEVKGIERRGAEWHDVVVGELLAVEKHPRADRLSLTRVRTGGGETLEIVCGATNIAAGQRVPVALPGAVLPGDRRIERTEKMGVVSNGMLCSGDELRLTGDADGILILPADTPVGASLADLYGDIVLDVDVKPNRGDALSILGIAREVSAVTGAPVRWPSIEVEETGGDVSDRLRVEVRDERLCPRFVGRWVSGVNVGPSPDHVQMRLLAAGMRPVSNVVDASNYVMLEMGKPIHTFDAAAVRGGRIVVRVAEPGERIETLDHVERELAPETLLIADAEGPIGIAGVMGGAGSEVGDGTTDVIVESAIFDPVSIRRTAFRYALRSEASLRFEKGQEFRLARVGADRTARLVREWAGGQVARGRVDTHPDEPAPRRVAFRPARVDRLLGTALGPAEQHVVLSRVGVEAAAPQGPVDVPVVGGVEPTAVPAHASEALVATIPTWRRDLEIEADIAEEIARVRGYEQTAPTLPDTTPPTWVPSPLGLRNRLRAALAGAGVNEAVTYALVSRGHLESFTWTVEDRPGSGEAPRGGEPITVTNPLSLDHSLLRQSLVGSLVDVVSTNLRRGNDDVAVFEVGKGYGRTGDTPTEWWRLAIALTGGLEPASWNRPGRAADVDDMKGLVELLAVEVGSGRPRYEPIVDEPILHPGRSARVTSIASGGAVAISGLLGELHPRLVAESELRAERVVVAELSIAGLSGGVVPTTRVAPPPRFPAVDRDLAVVVSDDRPAGEVAETIERAAGELLASATLFDVYRGRPLADDERSLAFRLRFVAADRTLTEAEIDAAVAAIVADLESKVGGRIRG